MIFQDPYGSLDPRQRAGDIVMEPMKNFATDMTPQQMLERVKQLFEIVGLDPDYTERVPHAANPRLIYGALSGFGCYGPYSQRPGYDIISQGMGGLMSVTGAKGGEPTRSGNAMGDILGGMNLVIGVLTAVNARSMTGSGQRVDVSLVDSVVASLENAYIRYFKSGELPERNGNAYASIAPYDTYHDYRCSE